MIITILRKNLDGSVTDNTLKHGCGALNIDDTRISTSDSLNGGAYAENPTEREGKDMWTSSRKGDSNCFRRGGAGDYEQPSGRWPANFILTHKKGCELKGTKKVKTSVNNHKSTTSIGGQNAYGGGKERVGTDYADKEGKETVANWDCIEGCLVQELDRQSGINKSTGGRIGNKDGGGIYGGGKGLKGFYSKGESGFGDVGGASRFFKQFEREEDQ